MRPILIFGIGKKQGLHNRLRGECLSKELFLSLAEVRVVIEDWRKKYN